MTESALGLTIPSMANFPKTLVIRGIPVQVEDFDELDEFIQRYGTDVFQQQAPSSDHDAAPVHRKQQHAGAPSLDHTDRTLLQQFIEAGKTGVPSKHVEQILGKKGRGIPIALDAFSRRVGLATQEGSRAFTPVKTSEGRGFKMTELHIRSARSLLGQS